MINNIKQKHKRFKKKHPIIILMLKSRYCAAVMMILIGSLFLGNTVMSIKTVSVAYDGKIDTFTTTEDNVLEVVARQGINIGDYDLIDMDVDGDFYNIGITRGFPVNLFVDGEHILHYVTDGTVADLLAMNEIELAETDQVSLPMDALLEDGIEVRVKRIIYRDIITPVSIPHKNNVVDVMFLPSGKAPTDVAGKDGLKNVKKREKLVDGVVVETKVVSETVERKPVDGTKYNIIKGKNIVVDGTALKYKAAITMNATAYTYGEPNNVNALGKTLQVGMVAVSKKHARDVKFGDKVYIETADGKFVYGYAVVCDVGNSTDPLWIDLFLPTKADVKAFGRRKVTVYVLE